MKKKYDLRDYPDRAVEDSDNPPLTDEQLRRMRPLRDFPELHAKIMAAVEHRRAAKRGRPPLEHPKVQVTLRLDEDVLNSFKEDGPGWQGRINEELKKTMKRRKR